MHRHQLHICPEYLNTPRLIANDQQQVVWRNDNTEPFSSSPSDENPSGLGVFEMPLRLGGVQYFDKESNLSQNGKRDFDPALGRFPTADPIGLKHHLNPYSYANLNPLSYIDPTGEAATLSWCAAGPIACAAGVTVAVGAVIWAQGQSGKKTKDSGFGDVPTGVVDFPANDPCKPDRNDCPAMQTKLLAERQSILAQLGRYPGLKLGAWIALFNNKAASHNAFCPNHTVDPI
jgi:RHS repeat-associated protein